MKKTNLFYGIVLSVLLAFGFSSCEEDITTVDNDPPVVSLLSGSQYVSSDANFPAESTVLVNLKAVVGTGDLKLVSIFENGSKMDLERISGGLNSNPATLFGDDQKGFEKEISFKALEAGVNDYYFLVEDVNGLKDSAAFTLTTYNPETLLNFSVDSIKVGNFKGPAKGSIDLQTGTPVSSGNANGDVQDFGWTDGTTDWAKKIKPKNGTEMVIPAADANYDDITSIEKLKAAYENGTVAEVSGDVAVGSIFFFKSPSDTSGEFDYFVLKALVVEESVGDNNDYYIFSLKGHKY